VSAYIEDVFEIRDGKTESKCETVDEEAIRKNEVLLLDNNIEAK
jgi:hypothetical protein